MAYIPVEDRLKIGEMVKYYRTQQDLTQKELAKKSKKHISTIQRIESPTASRGVARDTVIDIAIALKKIHWIEFGRTNIPDTNSF